MQPLHHISLDQEFERPRSVSVSLAHKKSQCIDSVMVWVVAGGADSEDGGDGVRDMCSVASVVSAVDDGKVAGMDEGQRRPGVETGIPTTALILVLPLTVLVAVVLAIDGIGLGAGERQ